jgi:hypothetical protein
MSEGVTMTRFIAACLGLWLLMPGVDAATVAGIEVPETARPLPNGPKLQLNGAGIRKKFFVKVYVGALYLLQKADTTAGVVAQTGPKRVSMHILYGEVSRKKLVAGWNEGFANNHSEAELAGLAGRLETFNGLFETVHKGDVIALDYLPGEGTRVTIREQVKGTVPGKDFYDGLLRVWVGEKPATQSLKKAMLGV